MGKFVAFLFLISFTAPKLFSQLSDTTSTTRNDGVNRAVVRGDNCINIYYGNNLVNFLFRKEAGSAATDMKRSSVGPVGIVYEHLLSDGFGLGVEFGYSQSTLHYYDVPDFNQNKTKFEYTLNASTLRAMVRLNFHFAGSKKFDAYWLISTGYRHVVFSYTTNDPYIGIEPSFFSMSPIGVKPGIGFRYFFNNYIGLNLEIALGTPILGGGVSFKF
ncbi:MAG: hypothetical protein V4635_10170 [Bacteroidota bacterium]